jgi:hypothetical protein
MRNVNVMIIIKSVYWSAWQQLRDKLQANTGETKLINTEANKQKQRWKVILKEGNSEELQNTEHLNIIDNFR